MLQRGLERGLGIGQGPFVDVAYDRPVEAMV